MSEKVLTIDPYANLRLILSVPRYTFIAGGNWPPKIEPVQKLDMSLGRGDNCVQVSEASVKKYTLLFAGWIKI